MRVLHRPNGSCTVLPRQQFRQPSPLSAFSQVQAKQLKPALVRIGRKVGEEVRSRHHIVGKRAQRGAVGLQIGDSRPRHQVQRDWTEFFAITHGGFR